MVGVRLSKIDSRTVLYRYGTVINILLLARPLEGTLMLYDTGYVVFLYCTGLS